MKRNSIILVVIVLLLIDMIGSRWFDFQVSENYITFSSSIIIRYVSLLLLIIFLFKRKPHTKEKGGY